MTSTKKNLLLLLVSGTLLNAAPAAHAAPKHSPHRTARMAWSAAETHGSKRAFRATKAQEVADESYRSNAERTMINPG